MALIDRLRAVPTDLKVRRLDRESGRHSQWIPDVAPGSVVRFTGDRSLSNRRGSVEHYWHYLLGFLLPLSHALQTRTNLVDEARLIVPSCGPVMDRCTSQLLEALGCDARIEPLPSLAGRTEARSEGGHAGDAGDARDAGTSGAHSDGEQPVDVTIALPRWDRAITRPDIDPRVVAELLASATSLRELADGHGCCRGEEPGGRHLLLARAPSHPFYEAGGGAENPGYGAARRALAGLDECAAALEAQGIPAVVYAPASHSVFCQARTFALAAGWVGLHGAEMVNMVWSDPRSPQIDLRPRGELSNPQRDVARILRSSGFTEVHIGSDSVVVLDPSLVARLVTEHHERRESTDGP